MVRLEIVSIPKRGLEVLKPQETLSITNAVLAAFQSLKGV